MKMKPISPLDRIGLLDDRDILLDQAALALAAADRPQPRLGAAQTFLDQLAAALPDHITGSAAHARALVRVLAEERGFAGDQQDYDNPANADFLSLLDRRRGLPVTLAILYVALARRRGWRAQPLALPGHVLVAIGGPADQIWIDAFAHGRIMRQLHHPNARTARKVSLLNNRETLVRLLSNQVARARMDKSTARQLILHER